MWARRRLEGRGHGPSVLLSLALHGGLGLSLLATATHEHAARAETHELSIELEPLLAAPRPPSSPLHERPTAVPGAPAAAELPVAHALAQRPVRRSAQASVTPRARVASIRATPTERTGTVDVPATTAPLGYAPASTSNDAAPETAPRRPSPAGPYAPGDVSEPPRLLAQPTPRYPPRALRLGIGADVVLSLIVEATGDVSGARLVRPAGHGFDEAALDAARRLRFAPGRAGGTAVAVRVTWTCRFRADG